MTTGGSELVATNEPTVVAKPFLDPIVVEDSQSDGGLANTARANESDWKKVLSEINYVLDQLVTSKEGSWGRRGEFSKEASFKCEMMSPLVA